MAAYVCVSGTQIKVCSGSRSHTYVSDVPVENIKQKTIDKFNGIFGQLKHSLVSHI